MRIVQESASSQPPPNANPLITQMDGFPIVSSKWKTLWPYSELAVQTPVNGKEFSLYGQSVFHLLETMGKPSICVINGFALGGGCELALSCTIRIASKTEIGRAS